MSPSFSMSSNFHSFDFSVRLRISKKDLHCSGIKCKTKSSAVIKLLLCLPHNTPQRIKKGITLVLWGYFLIYYEENKFFFTQKINIKKQ